MVPGELDGKAQHRPVEYSGPGETFVRHIANATYGGQVVLTEPAWTTVQDHIPGQAQVPSPCSQSTIAHVSNLGCRYAGCQPGISSLPLCRAQQDMSLANWCN